MLNTGLQTLLQLIYPPRCLACGGLVEQDHGLCAACFADMPFITGLACSTCGVPLPGASDQEERCDDCLVLGRPWRHGSSPLLYQDSARRLVLSLKHGDRHEIVGTAADWMVGAMKHSIDPETLVAPVPLHILRLLHRRYNQSALLAQAVSTRLGLTCVPDLMIRNRRTPSLDGKSRDQRFRTLDQAIQINPKRAEMIKGRPVLLVDDVMTSGATLAACALSCHNAQAREVCVTVLARVAKAA